MINLLRVLVLLTVFLTPLLGPGQLGYEQTKVLFFFLLISTSGLVWLYLIYQKKISLPFDKFTFLAATFLAWLLITSLTGLNPKTSLLGAQPYIQGWITYFFLFLFFLMTRSAQMPLTHLALTLTYSNFLVSIVALKDWVLLHLFYISVPTYAGRVISTFGQPNLYSGFLLLSLPFILYLLPKSKLCNLILALDILAVLISQSRAATVGLLVLLLIWLATSFKSKLTKINLFLVPFLLVILAALFFFSQNILRQEINSSNQEWLIHNSPEKRLFIWPIFLSLIKQSPHTGYGLENISSVYQSYFAKINFNTLNSPASHALKNLQVDRSHNYLIDLAFSSGLPGAALWLAFFFLVFKKLTNQTIRVGLILYLCWVQLQPQGIVQLIYFWLLASMAKPLDNS